MLINPGDLTSASFRVTVSGNDEFGFYNLAKDVPGNYSVNIGLYKSTENIGTLSVGGTVSNAYRLYLLRETNGIMYLNIAEKPIKTDINQNRISDVIFYEESGERRVGYWMDGTTTWQSAGSSLPAQKNILGGYDMNHDGSADLVTQETISSGGSTTVTVGYYASGIISSGSVNFTTIGSRPELTVGAWDVKVGNLTGNAGKNSIVWHETASSSSGTLDAWTDGTSSSTLIGTGYKSEFGWTMLGCGDFDGDGQDSVLMSLGGYLYSVDLDGTLASLGNSNWASYWEIGAIGDFSGDGKDDIVFFNQALNTVAMLSDGNADSFESLGQLDATDWFIAGSGDYDGDAKDDLLVRQYSTGMLGYYSGGDIQHGWNVLGNGVGTNWTVIA